ncbi:MAG: TolC family protein [Rikenellaceae bacterium]
MKHPVLIITTLLLSPTIQAQESITQQEYREQVLQTSYTLKATIQERTTKEESLRAQKTAALPTLALALSGTYQEPNYNGYEKLNGAAELTLSQTIYNGGVTRALTQYREIEIEQANQQIQVQYWSLILKADQNYWDYQATLAQMEVAQRYIQIIDSLERIVDERFRAGYVSRTDLLMVQTRLSQAQTAAISAQESHQKARETLIEEGGLETTDLRLSDPLTQTPDIPKATPLDQALEQRPDFLVYQTARKLQEQNIKITRNSFNPKVSVGVKGTAQNQNISMPEDLFYQGYLTLQSTLFHWGERRKSVDQARSSLRKAEYQQQQKESDISLELKTSYTSLQGSYNQVVVSQENLALAEANLQLNTFSYTEGKSPIIDVLSAQIAWIDAFTSTISASYQYHIALSYYQYVTAAP